MKRSIPIFVCIFITIQTFGQGNKPRQTLQPKAFVPGVIEETASKELAEKRILNVYLPEG
jgi:hypothetical protein